MAEYKFNPDYKYDYNICTVQDDEIFKKQCKALEKYIPGLVKINYLVDVDSSQIQIYQKDGMQISVINDYDIGAVYIRSEFDIDPYFE